MDRTKASDAFNAGSIPVGCISYFRGYAWSEVTVFMQRKYRSVIERAINIMAKDIKKENQKKQHPVTGEKKKNSENKKETTENKSVKDELNTDIKGTGKFGLGHKKTRESKLAYAGEDIRDAFIKAKNWCVKNYRTTIPALICLVLAVIVVITLVRNARISRQEEQALNNQNAVTDSNGISVPEEPLQENAYDYINQFVAKYYTACMEGDVDTYMSMRSYTDEVEQIRMQKKANYIEYYQNITCYTKPGPVENSYIVYVYYEVKFRDIDTVAPGLNTLYVCTNDNGELYVFSGDVDESVSQYMQAVSLQEDVKDLFNKVQVNYNDAVAADENLKAFLEELAVKLKEDVAIEVAQIDASNTDTAEGGTENPDETQQETNPGENSDANPDANTDIDNNGDQVQQEEQPVTETVRTTDLVNVRGSASAEATKLGTVSAGTRLTRIEALDNGWSKVDYNGQDGYIKTEYLEVVESANGTVTALQNVNIRAEANETAEKLGVAYAGATLELIETQDDGWSRIIFNGQTAYVKSEYVQ